MTYKLQLEIWVIIIFHIISLLLLLGINFAIFLKAKKNMTLWSFISVQGCVALWMIAKILKTVSPIISYRWFFVVLQYAAIALLEVSFLEFAHIYGRHKRMPRRFRVVLYSVAFAQFIFVATNNYHYLFYSYFDFYKDYFGRLFYLHMGIFYASVIIGILLCHRQFKSQYANKVQFYWLSIAIMFPLIMNIIYVQGYLNRFLKSIGIIIVFDITPIAMMVSLLVFLYAIYKHDFLDMMPLYKEEIVKEVHAGIWATDKKGRLIEANEEGLRLQDRQVLKDFMASEADFFNIKDTGGFYECYKKILYNGRKHVRGYVYTCFNVTKYEALTKALYLKNQEIERSKELIEEQLELEKELSRIATRNYFARELHDILGHSMTVAIKLLEIAALTYEDDLKKAITQLEETEKVVSRGYADLRKSIVEEGEVKYDRISLKNEIKKVIKILEVAGVKATLKINEENGLLTDLEFQTIRRFCQECISNALKHGRATKVDIEMVFDRLKNKIIVTNNGLLPVELKKGNGLKGLEHRAKALGGQVVCRTDTSQFTVSLDY